MNIFKRIGNFVRRIVNRIFRRNTVKPVNTPQIKSVVIRRTKEEYLSEVKANFIDRFIDRLHAAFPSNIFDTTLDDKGLVWHSEWDEDVRMVLNSMSVTEIDILVTSIGLDKMYYESDDLGFTVPGTAKDIYDYIVQ